jgi:DMSO reductase family type II enzyme chaperone
MGRRADRDGGSGAVERNRALCRSLLYQALALGFRPPTPRTSLRLGTDPAAAALAEAAAVLAQGTGASLPAKALALALPASSTTPEELQAEYLRLFGHTARGPVPAYETEYGEETLFQKPQEMSDIAGFLRAFSLVLDPASRERIDHVSCELEFLAFLARKEAHALETGDDGMLEETRKAQGLFLRDHLGRFVPSFTRRLRKEDPGGFYGALGALCLELVTFDCGRLGVTPGSESLPIRVPIDDGAPTACAAPEGCAPGGCCPVPGPEGEKGAD